MANKTIQGFTRDDVTGALLVTGISGGGGSGGAVTDLVLPYISPPPSTVSAMAAANRLTLLRCLIPKTGILHDVSIWVGTSSGNYLAGVYDVGEASGTGSITELWDSGSQPVGAANGWRIIGDPNLAVTAGQNIYLGFMADNITATFGRVTGGNSPSAWGPLPSTFLTQPGGMSAKLASSFLAGGFAMPTPIADATVANPGTNILAYLIARVS